MEKALEKKENIDEMIINAKAYKFKKNESEIVMRNDPVNGFPDLSQHNNLLAEVIHL